MSHDFENKIAIFHKQHQKNVATFYINKTIQCLRFLKVGFFEQNTGFYDEENWLEFLSCWSPDLHENDNLHIQRIHTGGVVFFSLNPSKFTICVTWHLISM